MAAALSDAWWDDEAAALQKRLLGLLTDAAVNGASTALRDLAAQAGVEIDFSLVNTNAADWAANYAAQLAKGITDTTRDMVQESLADWVGSGDPLPDLIDTLGPLFGPDRAELIAVTEATRAFAEGNRLAWQESGMVDGIRWMTTNDDLVCDICGPLDGVQMPLDSVDIPPAHPRCRCWIQPVVSLP